jgi:hypothetical protein
LQILPANIPPLQPSFVWLEEFALGAVQSGSNFVSSVAQRLPASEILILRQGKF